MSKKKKEKKPKVKVGWIDPIEETAALLRKKNKKNKPSKNMVD